MKIEFESSIRKGYIEVFPQFAIMWKYDKGIYLGWIFWCMTIKKN